MYFPSDFEVLPSPKELRELVEHCEERKLELLAGSYANSLYGVIQTSTQRRSLCEYLIVQELLVLNNGEAPIFVTNVKEEILDLKIGTDK